MLGQVLGARGFTTSAVMSLPRVLWVATESPNRRLSGGSIRQSYLLEALARAAAVDVLLVGGSVDEHCARAVRDVEVLPQPAGPPRALWVPSLLWSIWDNEVLRMSWPVATTRERRRLLAPHVRGSAPRYDVIHFEHERLAPLGREPGLPVRTITLHNLRSEQAAHRLADEETSSFGRWLARRARGVAVAFESDVVRDFDGVFVTSPDDAQALSGNAMLVPNGVDVAAVRPAPLPGSRRIVFVGRLDWPPNVEGLRWFCKRVLPRVRSQIPAVELDIVGFNPVSDVLALAGEGVAIHPSVPSVLPFLRAARVAVVPLRVGSGTRLKALEALAAGRPVVGTQIGLAGLGLESGRTAVIADDPDDMASAIVRLVLADWEASAMAEAGRRHVEDHFDWQSIAPGFVQSVLALAERARAVRA
jgi:glycosyltransferase involved in cell wall biosynthesis